MSPKILRAHYGHVMEHFQFEEAFMKDSDYPDYQKHVGAHKLMLDKRVDVRDKINKHEWRQRDVLVCLREWISPIL